MQGSYGGNEDAFVAKLNTTGTALVYSTYLGGNNDDVGYGIAVDSFANAYVTGYTGSSNFPTTAGAFQTSHASNPDMWSRNTLATAEARPMTASSPLSKYVNGGSDSAPSIFLTIAFAAYAAFGQSSAPSRFEVASIKPSDPAARGRRMSVTPGGRFAATNASPITR